MIIIVIWMITAGAHSMGGMDSFVYVFSFCVCAMSELISNSSQVSNAIPRQSNFCSFYDFVIVSCEFSRMKHFMTECTVTSGVKSEGNYFLKSSLDKSQLTTFLQIEYIKIKEPYVSFIPWKGVRKSFINWFLQKTGSNFKFQLQSIMNSLNFAHISVFHTHSYWALSCSFRNIWNSIRSFIRILHTPLHMWYVIWFVNANFIRFHPPGPIVSELKIRCLTKDIIIYCCYLFIHSVRFLSATYSAFDCSLLLLLSLLWQHRAIYV